MKQFKRAFLKILIAVSVCAPLFDCGAATFVVGMRNFFFTPTNLLINVNDTVRWTNQSSFAHDSTHGTASTPAANRLWASPSMAQGEIFSLTFSNEGFFPYICKAHVVDDGGSHPEQTGTVSVITGNLPPLVHITSPANNNRFTNAASITINANAADTNGAVDRVDFLVNGRFAASDAAPPYSVVASNLVFGTNILRAVATDNLGLSATSAPVSIIATNFATTNVVRIQGLAFNPPVITVAAGSSVVWTNADAVSHTATGEPFSLEPLCGPSVLISATRHCTNRFMTPGVYPYFCSIHPTMRGTVVVVSASSTPIVSLIQPAAGGVFFSNSLVTFEASASDPNGIASVEFFHSANMSIGSSATAPYGIQAALPAGNYSVFAKATDLLGFGALTPQVPISVVAPVALRLLSPALSGGSIQFDLNTTPGSTYVIEAAPQLPAPWSAIQTNMATGATLQFTDPQPVTTRTQRFYRAFQQP